MNLNNKHFNDKKTAKNRQRKGEQKEGKERRRHSSKFRNFLYIIILFSLGNHKKARDVNRKFQADKL